jgi:DNA mismatch repair protein MutS2
MQVPTTDLVPSAEPRRPQPTMKVSAWAESDFTALPEINLLGLRADEAIAQVESAVDAAVRAALPVLRIIHGKGTGALRQVVTNTLKTDPRVKTFRSGGPGEGGMGVTVAELR